MRVRDEGPAAAAVGGFLAAAMFVAMALTMMFLIAGG